MSKQRLRHVVGALICGLAPLIPLIPMGSVSAATPAQIASVAPATTAVSESAVLRQFRDSGPPTMAAAAQFEATAPIRNYAKTQVIHSVNNPRLFREVFGFAFASSLGDPTIGYPSWNFGLLSTVAYFGVHVAWTGDFSDDSGLQIWNDPNGPVPGFIQTAHANGTRVVLTIEMFDSTNGTPNMCSALQRGALTIQRTVAQINARGIDGVNIDYESNNSSCTDPSTGAVQSSQSLFTTFVQNMHAALPAGSYLSLDSYSGAAGYRDSSGAYLGFFNIGALANAVDSFFVMAYDMEYANWDSPPLSCPNFCIGPTAPLSTYLFNDGRASSEYRAVVPASKIIMGIPYYGRKECVGGYTPSTAPPNAVGSTSAVADGYLDASTENGYFANSDYQSHRETRDPLSATRWDTFTSSTAGCTRELYWDDATALGNKYNLIVNDGLRGAGIFALNYGGGAPELWNMILLKFGQCSSAAIAADHTSPQIPGTPITFTGSAFCAGTPEYRFWTSPPGGGWSVSQPYSATATSVWDTTGKAVGTYRFEVDARNLGSPVSYDTAAIMPMRLALCVTPTLTPDHASPQLPKTVITFTAAVTCKTTPEYRFWMKAPGGGWSVAQDYSTASTLRWDTTGKAYGAYDIEIDARTQGTTVSYESVTSTTYNLTSCISTSLTTDKTSPQPTGTQVNLTGAATCDGTPQYRFLIQSPGGSSSVVQDFGGAAAYAWNAGGPGGTYSLELDAKSAAAPVGSMTSAQVSFDTVACRGAAIAASPSSPQVPGAAVVLTGGATCTGTPQYRFQIRKPAASWGVVQAYSPASTYNWNTTGLPIGDYGLEVDVRNAGATTDYETTVNIIFTLARPACTTPTLTSDVASPQGTGAFITFTSTTTTCPQPVYRFWVMAPGASWGIARDFSTVPTFRWLANGVPGAWGVEVDVRDASRPLSYDAVTNVTYAITACSGATLTTDIAAPQTPGAQVTLTGAATCPRTAEFRFWIQPPGGGWVIVRDFGTASTFVWHTTTPGGSYGLEVDVRDQGAAAAYETKANITYGITAPCNLPTLSPNVASPQPVATAITFTAATSGCLTPQYRFWVRPPGGSYVVQQDYSATATFSWGTTGLATGTYGFEIDVRNQGSTASYDAARGLFFTLNSPACSAPTLKASTGPPGGTGAPVTLTGTATGCPAPQFRFWARAPGGSWGMARDYATSPTYVWPGGVAAGTYSYEVDVRALGSSATYEAVANITYALVACTGAGLSPNPTSPQAHGTQVVLTGSATCLGTAEYRFWVRAPGGAWTIARDYGPMSTFTWTPATAGTYQVEVDVRDQGAGATYETVANISFAVT